MLMSLRSRSFFAVLTAVSVACGERGAELPAARLVASTTQDTLPLDATELLLTVDEAASIVHATIARYSMYRRAECIQLKLVEEEQLLVLFDLVEVANLDCGGDPQRPRTLDRYVVGRWTGSLGVVENGEWVDFNQKFAEARRCRPQYGCESREVRRGRVVRAG